MVKAKYPSKADKAQALIDAGAVRLFPGLGYATVVGSKGDTYTITRQDGCNCPNGKSRDPRSCYHAEAARILCEEYRRLSAQARETGRVTIPPALMRALGGYRDVEAPSLRLPAELVAAIGSPEPPPVPAGAERDGRGVIRCLKCGSPLTPDGRCPEQDARLKELGYEVDAA